MSWGAQIGKIYLFLEVISLLLKSISKTTSVRGRLLSYVSYTNCIWKGEHRKNCKTPLFKSEMYKLCCLHAAIVRYAHFICNTNLKNQENQKMYFPKYRLLFILLWTKHVQCDLWTWPIRCLDLLLNWFLSTVYIESCWQEKQEVRFLPFSLLGMLKKYFLKSLKRVLTFVPK